MRPSLRSKFAFTVPTIGVGAVTWMLLASILDDRSREILRVTGVTCEAMDRSPIPATESTGAPASEAKPPSAPVAWDEALRRWAAVDVEAAGAWALAQSYIDHGLAFAAVFRGACVDSERAVRFARELAARDPSRAASYGSYLISAFSAAGEHRRAADFAANESGPINVDWLTQAYAAWSRREPENAVLAAVALTDRDRRRVAFQAGLSGWAHADPGALAEQALGFVAGPERKLALTLALHTWASRDRGAVITWVDRQGAAIGMTETEINRALAD
jgi:hypothetical protein